MSTSTATERGVGVAVSAAAGTWLVATALSQTPNRRFDYFRRYDRTMVAIPNWRFFAPSPAQHDNRVAYRVLFGNDDVSDWEDLHVPEQRRWSHSLFYPRRRRDKGITDLCMVTLEHVATDISTVEKGPGYRMLRGVVAATIEREHGVDPRGVLGFQFLIARDAGYDESEEPDLIFASRFEPMAVLEEVSPTSDREPQHV